MVKVGPALRTGASLVAAGVVAATVATTAAGGGAAPAPPRDAGGRTETARLIVQGPLVDVRSAVGAAGGRVTRDLPIVGGAAATVPAAAVPRLAGTPGLLVTPDRRVRVQGTTSSSTPKSVYRKVVRADELNAGGHTGRGVTVALVDTGVAEVGDLAGRLVTVTDDMTGERAPCVNLSGEAGCGDSYGHGTFMAGIIAGSGAASGGQYAGVAPGAGIVSVKVAGRDGSADVSTVLAAIQWVVSFKDRYGIRVLNLSLGTDSTQTYRTDPFNYAVERAWASGVAVVVAAANIGPAPGTIAKPGDDPWVVTVGAMDDRGTPGLGDDRVPDFSSRGPTAADGLAKPDITAPGAHMVSLEAPGSAVATAHPSSVGGGYRKGSGTSMATAVVSGVAALLIGADPSVTPDRLKFALAATARPTALDDRMVVGAGLVDAVAARSAPAGVANQGLDRSSGMGSLDASRGSVRVQADDPLGTVVEGWLTAQLLLWDPFGYTTGVWSQPSWYTSTWYGSRWQGSRWQGSRWQGSRWQGSRWQGGEDSTAPYGTGMDGSAWYGAWE